MQFKYYSIDVKVEECKVEVMGVNLMYKTYEGLGEIVEGEYVADKYAVINKQQLNEIIESETGSKKKLEFINKLANKIELALKNEIN